MISVVIPAYNAEKYVEKSIESVLCQMSNQDELILVDDGSTDKTAAILDRYGTNNVKVIHKENGGVVSARLSGTDMASGDYVIFLDSDDWLDAHCFETLRQVINTYNKPDLVCYGFYGSSDGIVTKHPVPMEKGFYDKQKIMKSLRASLVCDKNGYNALGDIGNGTKAFKRDILKECLVNDCRIQLGEDLSTNSVFLSKAESLYVCEECFYYYRYHSESVTHSRKPFNADSPKYRKLFLMDKLGYDSEYAAQIDREITIAVYTVIKSQYNQDLRFSEINRINRRILKEPEYISSIRNARFNLFSKAFIKKIILKYHLFLLAKIL